jgi:hypothetical protein
MSKGDVLRLLDELLYQALKVRQTGHYDLHPLSLLHGEVEKRLEVEALAEATE